jgi:hypothetical protein
MLDAVVFNVFVVEKMAIPQKSAAKPDLTPGPSPDRKTIALERGDKGLSFLFVCEKLLRGTRKLVGEVGLRNRKGRKVLVGLFENRSTQTATSAIDPQSPPSAR